MRQGPTEAAVTSVVDMASHLATSDPGLYKRKSWTLAELQVLAKSFESKGAMRRQKPHAYHFAHRKGGLAQIECKVVRVKHSGYTLDNLRELTKGFTSRATFKAAHPNPYGAACAKGWLDNIGLPPPRKYMFEDVAEIIATHHITGRKELSEVNDSAYFAARKNGWLDALGLPLKTIRHTLRDVKKAAAGYISRKEFALGEPKAYSAAVRNGWIDSIGIPLTLEQHTKESVLAAAATCSTRSEFMRKHKSAYSTAWVNGWLDDTGLPKHCGTGGDYDCFYLWRAEGEWFNGLPVYKGGVTSKRLGDSRIHNVAGGGGFIIGDAHMFAVRDALAVERFALSLGVNPGLHKCNGYTEFRAYTESELTQVLDYAKWREKVCA